MNKPLVVFRVDASLEMGSGHVMRCLTFADTITKHGFECLFVTREHPGHMAAMIGDRGHKVQLLSLQVGKESAVDAMEPQHAQWLGATQEQDAYQVRQCIQLLRPTCLVVDHYALDYRWEQLMRDSVRVIIAIDDLADRRHDCDLLLDQTFGRDPCDYSDLIPASSTCLCGAEYALLRSSFNRLRVESLEQRIKRAPRRILVSMGGVDKDNVTSRVLRALNHSSLPLSSEIVVVMGGGAPWLEQVKSVAAAMQIPTTVKVSVNEMAELMAASDIAIGAAGSTSWERCCLGLPTVMIVLAENQRYAASLLQAVRAVEIVSLGEELEFQLVTAIKQLISDSAYRHQMIVEAAVVTDGRGCDLVVSEMIRILERSE